MTEPPPAGKLAAAIGLVKNLTVTNLLMLAGLLVVIVPVYVIWKALGDPAVMDRLMSSYREIPNGSGCVLRNVKERAGPDQWAISSSFAAHGQDRWYVGVWLTREPTAEELSSHCETLKRIADTLAMP